MAVTSFAFLDEVEVPTFAAVERITETPLPSISDVQRQTITRHRTVTLNRKTGKEELTLPHRPFDIGFATVTNALLWARAEFLDHTVPEGEMLRYDGAHIILSLDGYTYSDCLFRNHGIPQTFEFDPEGRTLTIDQSSLPSDPERISEEAVFLGDIYDHFGHFLVETLTRLWFLDLIPAERRTKMRFVFFRTWAVPEKSMIWKILEYYGIGRDQCIVANRPFLFDRLIVPSQAQRPFVGWNLYYSHIMEGFYLGLARRIVSADKPNAVDASRKIYLSRERFVTDGAGRRSLLNSEYVENRFKSAGYTVIYPETLTFAEQLRLADATTHLAGPYGSAHHIAAFCRQLTRQDVLTAEGFFQPSTDVCFTMLKEAPVDYLFGENAEPGRSGDLNANWRLDQATFDAWFERRKLA